MRLSPAVLLLPLVPGCSLLGADSCSVDVGDRPAEVVSAPEVPLVPEQRANVVLDVTSTLEEPVRVTVRVDGSRVLDVELPGSGAACAHQPVYRYGYDMPAGPATVAVATDEGQSASRTFRASGAVRWLVVQGQDGFPLGLRVHTERPQWAKGVPGRLTPGPARLSLAGWRDARPTPAGSPGRISRADLRSAPWRCCQAVGDPWVAC